MKINICHKYSDEFFYLYTTHGTVSDMKKTLRYIAISVVILFACIGIAFTAVFFGMQHGLLNVRGSIMERNAYFGKVPLVTSTSAPEVETNGCIEGLDQTKPCEWNETVQWIVVRDALVKDAPIINRITEETGVSARMIVASVVPEQIRFFADNREVFKRYFEPLKILVSLSKFSLGVSGIKQDTAVQIENYAVSTTSDFYPGPEMRALIAYPEGVDHDQELFNRLTDEKDHYYSYLYTALYLKEITMQWKKAGYDVANRPDVLVTLFNLGFAASEPKPEPRVAGSQIIQGGQKYTFGYLGTLFYNSDELLEIFPR
jgi:hypothetical protein